MCNLIERAALSDVILLGTQAHVHLAAQAAQDVVAGRTIETGALVRSLRVFIREVLDLEALPDALMGLGAAYAPNSAGEPDARTP